MRILLLAPALFLPEGGIPRILSLHLKALCELSEPDGGVRFVSLLDREPSPQALQGYGGPQLEAWSACGGSKLRFMREALRLSSGCQHILCGHIGLLPVAALLCLRHPGCTFDLVAHGIEVWRKPRLSQALALRRVRRVLCVSAHTRDHMRAFAPVPLSKMEVLPNGLDPFFQLEEEAFKPDEPLILSVARLSREDAYKGIDHLIQAMPALLLRHPGARLRILGQGEDSSRLRGLADSLKLGQSVEMPGFVSDAQLRSSLAGCTLFALPSRGEGFGLVFLEAMAQGKPCLGARAGALPELITPQTGQLVDYGDVPGITAALLEMLGRRWDRRSILARSAEFSYPEFVKRLAVLLPPHRSNPPT